MSRVVVVLGGGGAAGWVFHTGALQELERTTGFQARQAELIIGTSAGAVVGAAIRSGQSLAEFLAVADEPPTEEEQQTVLDAMREREDKRPLRPLAPELLRELLPGRAGVGVALAGLLPPGRFPTWPLTARHQAKLYPSTWPDGLWVTAARVPPGDLVVFGRDTTKASLADAVEASCALPGLFEPKEIMGSDYVDGGVLSPTHAHLAAPVHPDLVVVIAPMSRRDGRPLTAFARRRLAMETEMLASGGIETLVVEPGPGVNEAFRVYPRQDRDARDDLLRDAREAVGLALLDNHLEVLSQHRPEA